MSHDSLSAQIRRAGEGRGWRRSDLEEGGRYVGIPPSRCVSALTPSRRSERSYNVAPPRSAKFNSARDNSQG